MTRWCMIQKVVLKFVLLLHLYYIHIYAAMSPVQPTEWLRIQSCPLSLDAGYVMYFDTRSGRVENAAILESRILYPKRAQQCLQFFYKMTGSLLDKLIIWVKQDDGTGNVRQLSKVKTFQGTSENIKPWEKARGVGVEVEGMPHCEAS